MRALDMLLQSFVAQQRMKLPGSKYVPCYRIVENGAARVAERV
jgi:hypothetical protein